MQVHVEHLGHQEKKQMKSVESWQRQEASACQTLGRQEKKQMKSVERWQ